MAQTMAAAPGWSGHAVMRGLSGHTDVGTQFMLGSMIPETYAFIVHRPETIHPEISFRHPGGGKAAETGQHRLSGGSSNLISSGKRGIVKIQTK